jgi:hypothetical protein
MLIQSGIDFSQTTISASQTHGVVCLLCHVQRMVHYGESLCCISQFQKNMSLLIEIRCKASEVVRKVRYTKIVFFPEHGLGFAEVARHSLDNALLMQNDSLPFEIVRILHDTIQIRIYLARLIEFVLEAAGERQSVGCLFVLLILGDRIFR